MVSRGVNSTTQHTHTHTHTQIGLPPLWLALPQMITLKPSKPLKLFAPPSLINITTMARHHKQFPPNIQQASPQVRVTPHVSIGTPLNNF